MLIDNAVVAFRATNPEFKIERSLVKAGNWIIKDADGNRITQGQGHSLAECEQMRDDAVIAAKLTAAMQEMISVRVLTIGMINAGAPPPGAKALSERLLPAMVDLWAVEEGGHG